MEALSDWILSISILEPVDQLWAWQSTDEIVLEPLFHKCAIAQLVGDIMNINGS